MEKINASLYLLYLYLKYPKYGKYIIDIDIDRSHIYSDLRTNEILSFATIRMDLKYIMLCEVSQRAELGSYSSRCGI